jgi:hypothetical protein
MIVDMLLIDVNITLKIAVNKEYMTPLNLFIALVVSKCTYDLRLQVTYMVLAIY